MAKARKQKPDGGGGATVLHQKLCLSIDLENQLIYGYTEIKVLLAENDTFALHADNMTIRNILVDGETAEFEYSPHWKNVIDQPSWSSVSCSKTAADAACSTYISSLTSEAVPNLIITSERSVKSITEHQGEENGEKHEENGENREENGGICEENGGKLVHIYDDQAVNGYNGSAEENKKKEEEEKENKKEEEREKENEKKEEKEKENEKEEEREKENEKGEEKEKKAEKEKEEENEMEIDNEKVKNTKLVHIDYILEKVETGVHFYGNVLHSSNQIRRAHCWFPCIDSATQRCPS